MTDRTKRVAVLLTAAGSAAGGLRTPEAMVLLRWTMWITFALAIYYAIVFPACARFFKWLRNPPRPAPVAESTQMSPEVARELAHFLPGAKMKVALWMRQTLDLWHSCTRTWTGFQCPNSRNWQKLPTGFSTAYLGTGQVMTPIMLNPSGGPVELGVGHGGSTPFLGAIFRSRSL